MIHERKKRKVERDHGKKERRREGEGNKLCRRKKEELSHTVEG